MHRPTPVELLPPPAAHEHSPPMALKMSAPWSHHHITPSLCRRLSHESERGRRWRWLMCVRSERLEEQWYVHSAAKTRPDLRGKGSPCRSSHQAIVLVTRGCTRSSRAHPPKAPARRSGRGRKLSTISKSPDSRSKGLGRRTRSNVPIPTPTRCRELCRIRRDPAGSRRGAEVCIHPASATKPPRHSPRP